MAKGGYSITLSESQKAAMREAVKPAEKTVPPGGGYSITLSEKQTAAMREAVQPVPIKKEIPPGGGYSVTIPEARKAAMREATQGMRQEFGDFRPQPMLIGDTVPPITLEATDAELQEIASFHGARCDAPYIHTYRIITPDNQSVFVEVAVNNTAKGKGLAKAKAEAAGYTVHKVVYSPGGASVSGNIPKGQVTDVVKDYLIEKGATWKNEYLVEGGYNLALMYQDSLKLGSKFRPEDLEKLFGEDVVDEARVFSFENIQLGDGQFMAKSIFRDLENYDAKYGTDYANITKTQGITGLLSAIAEDTRVREDVITELQGYKEGDGYNVDKFINENPTRESVQILKDAGFDDEVVDACGRYVETIQTFISQADSMKPATSAAPWAMPDYAGLDSAAFGRALVATDVKSPLSTVSNIPLWKELSDEDKAKVANYYINDPFKGNAFASLVSTIEIGKAKLPVPVQWGVVGAEIAGFIIAPEIAIPMAIIQMAAPMIAKASVGLGKEISITEIGMTSAMAIAAALPYVGPVVVRAFGTAGKVGLKTTQLGLTGGFLAGSIPIIKSKDVPLYDKAAAILFDVMMVRGLVKMIPKKAAIDFERMTPRQQHEILDSVLQSSGGYKVIETKAIITSLKTLKGGIKADIAATSRRTYKADTANIILFVDFRPVIKGEAAVRETRQAYIDMVSKINEYAHTELSLKQVQKARGDIGLAKSRAELAGLNKLKAIEVELEQKLKDLQEPMVTAAEKYKDTYLKNAVEVHEAVRKELEDMTKTLAMDIDSVTTQLFKARDALVIAKDIRELEGQIKTIEEEVAKGMPASQVAEYRKLVDVLNSHIQDLVRELRVRYLTTGEEVNLKGKNLSMEVLSLQQRLSAAVKEMQRKGMTLDYPEHRKGELATEAQVVKMERDSIEAIQKTTEAIYGKESYGETLRRLNDSLDTLISLMRKANVSPERATKVSFDIYDAIRKQDVKALKEGVRLLQLEAGKIKNRPLQLKAEEQVKLLEGLTAEKVMSRFKRKKPSGKVGISGEEGRVEKLSDFFDEETTYDAEIKREAERRVQQRYEELTKTIPSYMKKGYGTKTPEEIMDYLREHYDRFYWDRAYEGKYRDLDDFLDPYEELGRIRKENAEWEETQQQRRALEREERERELAEKQRAKWVKDSKWWQVLDNHVTELEKSIERKKTQLAEATRVAKPSEKLIETTKTPEERGQALAKKETALTITEEPLKEKMKRVESEERAAQKVRKAIKETTKGQEAKAREKESAFPGITTARVKEGGYGTITDYRTMTVYMINKDGSITRVDPMTGVRTTTKLSPKVQVSPAVREATKTGLQTYVQTLTQAATQTQARTATQTAVQQALQTATRTTTKTATKLQIQTQLKTITEPIIKLVTEVVTTERPPRIRPPRLLLTERHVTQGRQKIHREGPALAVHKQGIVWVSYFPPFRGKKPDVAYSREKPPWAGVIVKGRHSPQRTLRSIGKVPELIELPMGVVTARIRGGRHLTFSRSNGRKRGRVIE